MDPKNDERIVLTLDAGGTNFVFTAIQSNKEILEPITLPSKGHNLEACIDTIEEGFRQLLAELNDKPVAISFAFPGPSDYTTGIIGKLNNLPAFQGGIPLGPILQNRINLPVFINNDGDLYAYGEALSGFLPLVNKLLADAGIQKAYKNLVGLTLGTGFGGGFVCNQQLLMGDNSMAGEVWLLRNRLNPNTNAEEGISIRAIQRVYAEHAGAGKASDLTPKDIFDIAMGKQEGNADAAKESFRQLGSILGSAIADLITVMDSAIVIGGGLSGAMPLILPAIMEEINSFYAGYSGTSYPRLVQKVFNINDPQTRKEFLNWPEKMIAVPGTNSTIKYYSEARVPIGTSTIGTSKAVALGAYAYALKQL